MDVDIEKMFSLRQKISELEKKVDYLNDKISEILDDDFLFEEEKSLRVDDIKNRIAKIEERINEYKNELRPLEEDSNRRLLEIVKENLLKSISGLVNEEMFSYYQTILSNINSLDSLKPVADSINDIVRNDYINKITNIDDYDPNSKYRLICHAIGHLYDDYDGEYISCSILSNEQNDTYNSSFGLIYPPQSIVAACSRDMATANYSKDGDNFLLLQAYPTIQNIDSVIEETVERKKESNKKEYNEVVIRKTEPIGIFYKGNYDELGHIEQVSLNKLKAKYPNLKVIGIPNHTMNIERVRHPKADELNELENQKRVARQNNDRDAYNYAQQKIIKIVSENRMSVSPKQWDLYTTEQKEDYFIVKMKEAKTLNDDDDYNYWLANLNNLKERANINSDNAYSDSKNGTKANSTTELIQSPNENSMVDLSSSIDLLRMRLSEVQDTYHSMMSDGYIDNEELEALLGMIKQVINDGYSLKSKATRPIDLKVISVIINSLEEEQEKVYNMKNRIEMVGKTV